MYRDIGEQSDSICFRDVTSPINELDVQSNSSRGQKHGSPLSCECMVPTVFYGMTRLQMPAHSLTTACLP